MAMTPKQRELVRHALGLPNRKNKAYRNHYCIGPESQDYKEWEDLVSQGMAIKAEVREGWCGDFFYVTEKGKGFALLPGEKT